MSEARRRVWADKVDRARPDHQRELADASHDFLARDAARRLPGEPAPWLEGHAPTEAEAQAMHAYLDRIGAVTGAGPYPG